MDRIIKITLSLLVIIVVSFIAVTAYTGYVENAYRSSLSSTYTYTFILTTDSPLTNVTLFLPVPSDPTGNSPVIERISSHELRGIPDTWKTELYETGKGTFVKVTIPAIIPPTGTTAKDPYTISLSADIPSRNLIDTMDPVAGSPLFRPIQKLTVADCKGPATNATGGQCLTYLTTLYAKYTADPNAAVSFRSTLSGKNSWNIFGPETNEYRTSIYLLMFGEQNGWTQVAGNIEKGMGAYDAPVIRK